MLDRLKLWFIRRIWGPWPTEKYLTILEGEVYGPVRWENLAGQEKFITSNSADGWTLFKNQGPVKDEFGVWWEVSIIQKKSMVGRLITSPYCKYTWDMIKLQDQLPDGSWVPGTEDGKLWRSPFGWRRDLAGTDLYGERRYWIPTLGHSGSEYD